MPDEIDDFSEPTPEAAKLSRFDLRSLWRVTFWGSAAALAVVVVAGTALSDVGAERAKIALASVIEQAKPVVAPISPQSVEVQQTAELEKQTRELAQQAQQFQKEAQQLRDALNQLAADRDQLKGRIALLEQGLDDITGAIKRQASQAVQQAPKESLAVTTSPPPSISAPPTVTASIPEAANVGLPGEPIPAPVPLPPTRTAALAPAEPAPEPRRELGVDLGGAATLEQLRVAWATIKANLGPELVGMRPSYMTRQRPSGTTEYRLVIVGAFPDTAAALRVCGKLTPMRVTCRPGHYTVTQLADR